MWPTEAVEVSALDAGTDTPPRSIFLAWAQKFNQLINHVSVYMQSLLTSADAAAARTALDVPSRNGDGASGTWGISIGGSAAQLGGTAPSGFTKSSGTSELGSVARTSGNLAGGFSGGVQARNTASGSGTATFYDAVIGSVVAGGVQFIRGADGSVEVRIGRTPAGDPAVDRRVYDTIVRGDGALQVPGLILTGSRSWTNVTGSRTRGTAIQNVWPRDLWLSINGEGNGLKVEVSPNGTAWETVADWSSGGAGGYERYTATVLVPPTHYYRVSSAGTLNAWKELI